MQPKLTKQPVALCIPYSRAPPLGHRVNLLLQNAEIHRFVGGMSESDSSISKERTWHPSTSTIPAYHA